MRPSLDKQYQVGDMNLYNVITTIIKECRVIFSKEDLSNLCLLGKDFANIVPKVLHWLQVNVILLQDPCLGYKQQDHIDPYCVEMPSMAMIHFGLDPGKFVCFLLGEYTGQHRDVHCTLDAIQQMITVTSNEYYLMVALLKLPLRNLQATSWSSYLMVIPRVLLRILRWFKKQ